MLKKVIILFLILPSCIAFSMEKNHDHSIATSFTIDNQGYLWRVYEEMGLLIVDYSNDFGKTFSNPVNVIATSQKIGTSGDARPKIGADSKGNIFVTWTENLKKPYTGYIWFSSSKDRGKSFSQPIIVHKDREEITHRFDSLLIDKNDRINIAWIDKRDLILSKKTNKEYVGAAVYLTFSDDHGLSFKPERKVADNSCECCRIAIDESKNNLVLLWRHIYSGNIRDHAISFIKENIIAPPKRVTYTGWKVDACPHQGPALVADNSNNYHISWFDGGENFGLYYNKIDENGDALFKPIKIGAQLSISDHSALLSINQDLYLSWREINQESQKINLMISNDNGATWTEPQLIFEDLKTIDHPHLVSFKNDVYIGFNTKNNGFKLFKLN